MLEYHTCRVYRSVKSVLVTLGFFNVITLKFALHIVTHHALPETLCVVAKYMVHADSNAVTHLSHKIPICITGQVRKPTSSNVNEVWMLAYHKDGLWSSSFCLIFDSSVGLWVGIPSNGDSVYQTSKVIIQHSAEEKSLSPFDSKIACLCLSIKMNNIKHI